MDLFRFEHVRVDGAHRPRLVDADGSIPVRGVTAVAGPSGSGKSTLLRLCNRLEVPSAGRVLFRGDDVAELDPLRLRRRVGLVLQRPTPFPGTVLDNLLVADPSLSVDAARRAIERVGLEAAFLGHQARDLSGGEAQRVCVARTLVTEPQVLLADEPTASLDVESAKYVEELVCRLAGDGVPVVWVTHDREQVARIASTVVEMRDGMIVDRRELDDAE